MLAADRQGQQNQWAFPPTSFTPPAQQTPQPTWAMGSQVQPPPQSQSWANGRFSPTLSSDRRQPPRRSNRGLLVAAICVGVGALILIFVSIMVAGLQNSQGTVNTSTPIASTSTDSPKTPTVAVSPTPTYPGQQYIDNAQMASSVDTKTAKVIQATTTFKAGEKMYVAFNIHPGGQSGAVCLQWYLGSVHITDADFSFSVTPNSMAGYSYAIYGAGNKGPAYVEIYWASTKACTDKVLAQHVNFTVTS